MTDNSWMQMSAAELVAHTEAKRQVDSVGERHARELARWRAHCDNLTKLLAERVAMTPPPVMLADKESFEAGRILGARDEREACAKLVESAEYGTRRADTAAAIRARGAA